MLLNLGAEALRSPEGGQFLQRFASGPLFDAPSLRTDPVFTRCADLL